MVCSGQLPRITDAAAHRRHFIALLLGGITVADRTLHQRDAVSPLSDTSCDMWRVRVARPNQCISRQQVIYPGNRASIEHSCICPEVSRRRTQLGHRRGVQRSGGCLYEIQRNDAGDIRTLRVNRIQAGAEQARGFAKFRAGQAAVAEQEARDRWPLVVERCYRVEAQSAVMRMLDQLVKLRMVIVREPNGHLHTGMGVGNKHAWAGIRTQTIQ